MDTNGRESDEDSPRAVPAIPSKPTLPVATPSTTAKPGAWLSLFLAAFAGLACCAALFIVMLQFGGPLAIVAVLILGLGGLVALMHYLVWGWWLSKAIRDEVASEEREKP